MSEVPFVDKLIEILIQWNLFQFWVQLLKLTKHLF